MDQFQLAPPPQGRAGERLRRLRTRLEITTREVENFSRQIAAQEGSDEYIVSHARLTQIETGESTPSVFKLFTLSAIYGLGVTEILSFYVDLQASARYHRGLDLPHTHPVSFDTPGPETGIEFPIRFDPGFSVERTNLVSRMVEVWGEVPVGLLQQLDLRKSRYGYIGTNDLTMSPLLRPGSFVQIDERQRVLPAGASRTEFDRPIYFIELREGYVCSWCEVQRGRLLTIPHPLSPCQTQEFAFPSEAEIIGRVTAVALRLVPLPAPPVSPGPDAPKRPKQV